MKYILDQESQSSTSTEQNNILEAEYSTISQYKKIQIPIFENLHDQTKYFTDKYLKSNLYKIEVPNTSQNISSWDELNLEVKIKNLSYALNNNYHLEDFSQHIKTLTTKGKNLDFVDKILKTEDKEWYAYQMLKYNVLTEGTKYYNEAENIYENTSYVTALGYWFYDLYLSIKNVFISDPKMTYENQYPNDYYHEYINNIETTELGSNQTEAG